MIRNLIFLSLTLLCYCPYGLGWDSEEMEIFDVVEEIGQNFYEVFGISQTADLSEVKKAYRTLSRQIHPDKNDAPDAEVKFRQLVSIYEVLRNEKQRARYDRVLVEGLPDWRSAIYYYRHARKMSLLEIFIILMVVISITQYLMAWGNYIDRKHTVEELLLKKYKINKDKRKKKNEDVDNIILIEECLNKIPTPSWFNILPIQFVKFIIFLFTGAPLFVKELLKENKRIKEEEEQKKLEEEQLLKEEEERRREKKALKATKKDRKRVVNLPDHTNGSCYMETINDDEGLSGSEKSSSNIPVIVKGAWYEDDFCELTRLMAKYPGGTSGRWELIAEQMGRTVYEVTKMSNKAKERLVLKHSEDGQEVSDVKVKMKTKGTKEGEKLDLSLGEDEHWAVPQQKALEKALKLYPKGTDQRWDKISRCVPDKAKDECMIRFKYLAEKIRKKKEDLSKPDDDTSPLEMENTSDGITANWSPITYNSMKTKH